MLFSDIDLQSFVYQYVHGHPKSAIHESVNRAIVLSDREIGYSSDASRENLPSGFPDQVRQKLGCTDTEDGWMLETLDLGCRGSVQSVQRKTKALISCAVTDLRFRFRIYVNTSFPMTRFTCTY